MFKVGDWVRRTGISRKTSTGEVKKGEIYKISEIFEPLAYGGPLLDLVGQPGPWDSNLFKLVNEREPETPTVVWWTDKFKVGKKYQYNVYKTKNNPSTYICLTYNSNGYPVFENIGNAQVILLQNKDLLNDLTEVKEPRKARTVYVGVYEDNKGEIFINLFGYVNKDHVSETTTSGAKLIDTIGLNYTEKL